VKIEGANHEFQTLPHVVEDVTDIVLNLKKVKFKAHDHDVRNLRIDVNKEGAVTAGDIEDSAQCEVLNKSLVICTLDKKHRFEAELEVKVGRGFARGDENKHPDQPIGVIAIDSIFSPVTRVKYAVGNTRVGQRTDYDKLELEIWTDGRVTPEDALVQASSILKKHFEPFYAYDENAVEFDETPQAQSQENQKMKKLLNMSVNEIELSVRAANCLNNANITTVGQLAMKSEAEMLKYRNFGKKSLNEIKDKLVQLNLSLGMKFDDGLVDPQGAEPVAATSDEE
jgi:DNA-directed RNA polymerase subunit alpha